MKILTEKQAVLLSLLMTSQALTPQSLPCKMKKLKSPGFRRRWLPAIQTYTLWITPPVLPRQTGMKSKKRISLLPAVALILSLLFMTPTPAQAASVNTFADLQLACSMAGSGDVTLSGDITGAGQGTTQLTIERSLTLDLIGHSLTIDLPDATGRNSNGIKINPGVTLTIMDKSL